MSRCAPLEAKGGPFVCGRVAWPGGQRPRLAIRSGGVDAECEVAHRALDPQERAENLRARGKKHVRRECFRNGDV